ncbi:MAG: hypothetical protein NVS3B21_22720 [Acidimicrobiales bacterium]
MAKAVRRPKQKRPTVSPYAEVLCPDKRRARATELQAQGLPLRAIDSEAATTFRTATGVPCSRSSP